MKHISTYTLILFILSSCGGGNAGFEQRIAELEAERDGLYVEIERQKEKVTKIRGDLTDLKEKTAQLLEESDQELTVEIDSLVEKIQEKSNPRKISATRRKACLVEFRSELENHEPVVLDVPFTQVSASDWKPDFAEDEIAAVLNGDAVEISQAGEAAPEEDSNTRGNSQTSKGSIATNKKPETKEYPKRVIFHEQGKDYFMDEGVKREVRYYQGTTPYIMTETGNKRFLLNIKRVQEID